MIGLDASIVLLNTFADVAGDLEGLSYELASSAGRKFSQIRLKVTYCRKQAKSQTIPH